MKNLILMLLVFFLCAAPTPFIESVPVNNLPTANMSMQQELNFVEYVFESINDIVKEIDWNENRSYQPEVDIIGEKIQSFGYKNDDYSVAAQGAKIRVQEKDGTTTERIQVLKIIVVIAGTNQEIWQAEWENNKAKFPELENIPDQENKRKRELPPADNKNRWNA